MTSKKQKTIYIISDGTGETAVTMIRAALVQYRDIDINMVRCKNVRTEAQVESTMDQAFEAQAMIVHTVVSPHLRKKIRETSASKALFELDLMGPMLSRLDNFFEVESSEGEAGILRTVDDRYFRRIEAIEYTVKHDDGKTFANLAQADIVLVGISRTSKTPLSIFMSHKGWKVANVPLVKESPLPDELFNIDQKKIVALTIDPNSLYRIRRNRLEKFGQDPGGEYARLDRIEKEIDWANEIFKKNRKWPVFNVTDRALEETATEIIKIVAARMGFKNPMLF